MKSTYPLVFITKLATISVLGNAVLNDFFNLFFLRPLGYVLTAISPNLASIGYDYGTKTGAWWCSLIQSCFTRNRQWLQKCNTWDVSDLLFGTNVHKTSVVRSTKKINFNEGKNWSKPWFSEQFRTVALQVCVWPRRTRRKVLFFSFFDLNSL